MHYMCEKWALLIIFTKKEIVMIKFAHSWDINYNVSDVTVEKYTSSMYCLNVMGWNCFKSEKWAKNDQNSGEQ